MDFENREIRVRDGGRTTGVVRSGHADHSGRPEPVRSSVFEIYHI